MGIINKKETLIPEESTEIAPENDNEIVMGIIKESDLPKIIGGQIQKLNELQRSVTDAIRKAEEANKSADTARGKSSGIFHIKGTIESIKKAIDDLAQAGMSSAEAQRVSLEFQTKLAEINKFLFGLGISNIALNRSTVRQLQLKMEGASKTELSELAKQEILTVIRQLKAQEDILLKQQDLEEGAKQHDKQLKVLAEQDKKKTKKLNEQATKVNSNSKILQSLSGTVEKHTASLTAINRSVQQLKRNIIRLNQANDDLINKLNKYKKAFLIVSIIICVTIVLSIILLLFMLNK